MLEVLTESKRDAEVWDLEIKPQSSVFDLNLKDIWRYRDLLGMFVRRDVVTVYKQTILGPAWFFIQPILTTAIYIVVFGSIARIPTDGLPQILFYLSGIVVWNYFSESLNITSRTFVDNAAIFGKVYFPRLIMPLSKVASGLIKFGIQFAFFLLVFGCYVLFKDANVQPNVTVLLMPVYILLMAGLGLGFGIIFTSLTSKYRDLTFLIQFAVQLVMYATPVIYPLSAVPERYEVLIMLNPMTPIVEGFRYALLGSGAFSWAYLIYSAGFTLLLLLSGILMFNRVEKTFMDTV